MDTLTNVDNRWDGNFSPSARFNPCMLSSEDNIGVSVENALLESKHWFVLRVSYHREQKAYEWLQNQAVESYLPLHYEDIDIDGHHKRTKVPLLPNLIFVHVTNSGLKAIITTQNNKMLTYYYNHFIFNASGKNPPLIVPDSQMNNFIRLTSIDNDHILFVPREKCHFKSGDTVIVTDGTFNGITGKVARVSRQQRVVIEMEGIGCVTTAYIPSAFIKTLSHR